MRITISYVIFDHLKYKENHPCNSYRRPEAQEEQCTVKRYGYINITLNFKANQKAEHKVEEARDSI